MPVDDKITAYVKEICLLSVACKVSNTLSDETFLLSLKMSAINIKF